MEVVLTLIAILIIFIIVLLAASIKVIPEYERGVVFRLGRLIAAKGPGLFLLVPFIDRIVRVDLRIVTLDVPPQDVITKDNVTVKVDAVVYFRVIDPDMAVTKVVNYYAATSQISQTTLRNVLGQSELDDLLAEREKLNQELQKIIDEETDPWGIKVSAVEIKQVELPETMRRSMAAQAEAERDRRAKIIHAEGELQASQKLAEAGEVISRVPTTLQLRYLQTLTEIASEKSSTIIFPIPIDIFTAFMKKLNGNPEREK